MAKGTARFGDLYNLVCDRAALLVAWDRVKSNRGSRTAGLDGWTRWRIEQRICFLQALAQGVRRAWIRGLQLVRQILKQAPIECAALVVREQTLVVKPLA